ncbi:MAG TPA: hypothetical protein VGE08_01960 [Steroidobacter sp.]|uniref:hypothetical protein n=1 Tax=Steroidobacter sp. TaxID=1978227 RepID=UPI002ED818BB
METERKIERLRRRRKTLLQAYLVHVGWLTSTCAFAASGTVELAITTSLWLVLITVPPVLVHTVSVHRACRAIDPRSHTVGWVPVILATIFLTPFESALILPAKNLWVSRSILRAWDLARTRSLEPRATTRGSNSRAAIDA